MNHVLLAALARPWFIAEDAAHQLSAALEQLLSASHGPAALRDMGYYHPDAQPRLVGSCMVVPVSGVLMKNDYCGAPGMDTIGAWIGAAQTNPAVKSLVLTVNSPGGTCAGTEMLSAIIAASTKPVVAWVGEMAASAAYWSACPASHIMLSGQTASVGSIGTMARLEKKGSDRYQVVTATRSTRKNAAAMAAAEGNPEAYRQEILDPLNEAFISSVEKHRPGIACASEDVLEGALYFGSKAISLGLADSIGMLGAAIEKANQLANKQTMKIADKYPKLAAAAGMDEAAATAMENGNVELSAEQLGSLEAALQQPVAATAQALEDLQAELATTSAARLAAENQATELQTQLATAQQDLATAQARVTELEGMDATSGQEAGKTGDPKAGDSYLTSFDREKAALKARMQY